MAAPGNKLSGWKVEGEREEASKMCSLAVLAIKRVHVCSILGGGVTGIVCETYTIAVCVPHSG